MVKAAGTGEEALRVTGSECFDVIVVDPFAPGMGGAALLEDLRSGGGDAELVVLSGDATAADVNRAFSSGTFAVLKKPCRPARLLGVVERAAELVRLRLENDTLRRRVPAGVPWHGIVGESPAIVTVRAHVERCAATHGPVLIKGEHGTEKEAVARAIWASGARSSRPLLTLRTAGRPPGLLADELFGHDQGAFDGATSDSRGLLEGAHGATVFVEEIGRLDLTTQTALLRVIEQGELRRIGAAQLRRVDVRVIAATDRLLERETREGRFSEDLFYRLGPTAIVVPPLRDRLGDVPLLVECCLKALHTTDDPVKEMSPDAMSALREYPWPGNTRELAGVVECAVMRSKGPVVAAGEIRPLLTTPGSVPETVTLEELERRHVAHVLRQTEGNKSEAARLLDIGRRKLYHLMKRLGLEG